METPDGKIGHGELEIDDSVVMLSDAMPQSTTRPPSDLGRDERRRVPVRQGRGQGGGAGAKAGAAITQEVADQFWGDRFGSLKDPYGHVWSIATHVEDLTPEQIADRAKQAMGAMST